MGALSILFGAPASLMSDKNEVIIKPVISEDVSETASISSHAVEDGSPVSDHVDQANSKLQLTTVFSREMGIPGIILGSDKEPEEKIMLLKQWKESGELLTYSGPVFKGIGIFKQGIDVSMDTLVITGMSSKRDNGMGGGFAVSLSLEQVRIAYSKTTTSSLPIAAKGTAKKGKSETANTSDNRKSIFKNVTDHWVSK